MDGELKVNHDSATTDAEVLERQKQWEAIARSFDTDDYSDLEAAVDEAKISESAPKPEGPEPEPEVIEPSTVDASKQDSDTNYVSVKESIRQEKLTEKEALESALKDKREELAKLYAKTRRLIPGHQNKIDFVKARGEYETLLDSYLRLEAKLTYDNRMEELGLDLQAKRDELNESDEDFEAKKQALDETYAKDCKEIKAAVNQNFLENFLDQQNALSAETVKQIDKGSVFRKAVHLFRSNKYIKGAIIAAGVAGLAVATAGLAGVATGAVTIGFDLTAKGALIGAARGAVGGLISSRQDSKNSAIHSFQNGNTEEIQHLIEELGDVTDKHVSTKGVANWLMAEYDKAATADRVDNRKRTAIATGLGAALGALSSGIKVNRVTTKLVEPPANQAPDTIKITNFDNVNIAEGHGAYDTFTQMGGDPDKLQQALDIMHSIDSKYGLVPGDSGVTGSFAHTYPGPISSWPDAAQVYIEEVAKEWAKQGLIPSETISAGPIYGPFTQAVEVYVPTGFLHYLTGAAAGTIVGDVKTSKLDKPHELETQPEPGNQPVSPEASGGYYTPIADEIERQIAEREAAAVAAKIEAEITKREAEEKKKKDKLAKEKAEREAEIKRKQEEAAAALEAEVAEREAKKAAEALEAEVAEREAREAAEALEAEVAEREANERSATDIEAQIAAREATS